MREDAIPVEFARRLNVTTDQLNQGESGEKHPRGCLLKLMAKNGLGAMIRSRPTGMHVPPVGSVLDEFIGISPVGARRRPGTMA